MQNIMVTEKAIEDLLWSIGEFGEEGGPFLECKIGDENFSLFVKRLNYMQEHLKETEERNRLKVLADIASCERWTEDKKESERQNHQRFFTYLLSGLGMDYSDSVRSQLDKFVSLNSEGRLRGIPVRIADDHRLASYDLIVQTLKAREKPLTIVRFDNHTDTKEKLQEKVTGANYFSQIVLNPELAAKITRVIEIMGQPDSKRRDCNINGVLVNSGGLFHFPEIEGEALIDIDLDGCERGLRNEFNQGRAGGHIYGPQSIQYYNRANILTHPSVAAKILRSRVQKPVAVGIAFERGFRNRFFWYRTERDFLVELAA